MRASGRVLAILACTIAQAVLANERPQVSAAELAQRVQPSRFERDVALEIYKVVPANEHPLSLAMREPTDPVFPGEAQDTFVSAQCNQKAAYHIVGLGNALAELVVADCLDGTHMEALVANAVRDLAKKLSDLKVSEADARKAGLYYGASTLPDGSAFAYVPLIAVGHGVAVTFTALLRPPGRGNAVVVQASLDPMCQAFRESYHAICADPEGLLRKLAIRLSERFNPAR